MVLFSDLVLHEFYLSDSPSREGSDYHLCYDYLLREYLVVEFPRVNGKSMSIYECDNMYGAIQVIVPYIHF